MIIPVTYAQVSHFFTGVGAPTGAAVTYGVDVSTVTDLSAVLTAVKNIWDAEIMPFVSDSVTHSETLVKFGPNDTGASGTIASGAVGGDASDQGSPAVAFLIQKRTVLGGREGRGRIYLPGVPEAAIDPDGSIDGGKVTQLQTAFDDFQAALATATIDAYLLHNSATLPTPITAWNVAATAATQRRRLRR